MIPFLDSREASGATLSTVGGAHTTGIASRCLAPCFSFP
jgi:hypothetical protein